MARGNGRLGPGSLILAAGRLALGRRGQIANCVRFKFTAVEHSQSLNNTGLREGKICGKEGGMLLGAIASSSCKNERPYSGRRDRLKKTFYLIFIRSDYSHGFIYIILAYGVEAVFGKNQRDL